MEVNIVGRLIGASGFGNASFASWQLVTSSERWRLIGGASSGKTYVSEAAESGASDLSVWNGEIIARYACTGIQGWPKLFVEVNRKDELDRIDLGGYGFCHVPPAPGVHRLEIVTYYPEGSFWDWLSAKFVGGVPRYVSPEVIMDVLPRFDHKTVTAGVVHVELSIITKGFEAAGVSLGENEQESVSTSPPAAAAAAAASSATSASH